ncbi:MAG: hypothetical protein DRJ09_00920 [Bacteroidetes bacterium]|nr:MAG: hypothetical protein DRJ09_00920 [Bacteroidota bacterium]
MDIKTRVLLLIGFLALTIFGACHQGGVTPGPDPSKPDYDFSQSSKDYLYFLPNSYWVYQNDSTLNAYSVKLFSAHEEIRQSGAGASQYTYNAYWMYYSNNDAGLLKGELFSTNFSVPDDVPNTEERIYFDDNHYKIAFAPMYPFGQRILLGGEEGTFINKEFLDVMPVSDKVYDSVYHSISEDYTAAAPDTVFYHFYFAKHYGLIKYSILHKNNAVSFSLLESNVLQE